MCDVMESDPVDPLDYLDAAQSVAEAMPPGNSCPCRKSTLKRFIRLSRMAERWTGIKEPAIAVLDAKVADCTDWHEVRDL